MENKSNENKRYNAFILKIERVTHDYIFRVMKCN